MAPLTLTALPPLYGIINGRGQWMFDQTGRLMVFEIERIASATAIALMDSQGGGPYSVKGFGENGEPVDLIGVHETPKPEKVKSK